MKKQLESGSFVLPDFAQSPFLVLWELTRACGLACRHCRASAIRRRNPQELTTDESVRLLSQISRFGKPLIVFTGGDPVQREDLFEIIGQARDSGFKTAITPSATALTTQDVVARLKQAGIDRLAISLDGASAQVHDSFRRVPGSFAKTMEIIQWAKNNALPVQINTTVSKHNVKSLRDMVDFLEGSGIALWSVFFLVPTGRASQDMQLTALEAEKVLLQMAAQAESASFDIKATAAPQFRRVLIQSRLATNSPESDHLAGIKPTLKLGALRSHQSVNDGKGILFVSHTGDIYPSGFLPLPAGNVLQDDIVDVYRYNQLFKDLRNPELLRGKCGRCRYRKLCGGSRARAFAEHGDYLAEDSLCLYDEWSRSGSHSME